MITHAFVSPKPDRPDDSLMRPSDWNAEHIFATPLSLGGFMTLTNVGTAYDTIAQSRGLGLAAVMFTGVNRFRFGLIVDKVGTGTQSWQLWNQTDSVELAVIDDAGASTNGKVLEVVVDNPNITGIKLVRVRAKSTVAGDDPNYYGASLLLQRI